MLQAKRRSQVKVREAHQAVRCVGGNVVPGHTNSEAYGGQTISVVWADLRVGTSCGTMSPLWSRKEASWVCLGEVTVKQSKNGISGLRVGGRAPGGEPTAPTQAGGGGSQAETWAAGAWVSFLISSPLTGDEVMTSHMALSRLPE